MTIRRTASLLSDLARMNLAYLRDAQARARVRGALDVVPGSSALAAVITDETKAAPGAALPFAGLTDDSLALSGIRTTGSAPASVNVVVGQARKDGVFAGVRTALQAAAGMATGLGLPLRVLLLDPLPHGTTIEDSAAGVRAVIDDRPVEVVTRESIRDHAYSARDVWLATHYKTAHALQVACESGVIGVDRVAYLIQDYEPGFTPWSTDSVLAEATYRAGFLPIVNSEPLAAYLRKQGHDIPLELVFAPAFPETQLERSAAARRRTETAHVLFYARPRKHRNLYGLGASALTYAAEQLGSDVSRVVFSSLGERHPEVRLAPGTALINRGRLDWDEYFEFLPTVDVVLSLQQSPHPSHPPFDAAISGALAVTNDFDGGRRDFHPRINAVPADTVSLGDALVDAIRRSWNAEPEGYLPVASGKLGREFDAVLLAAASRFS